MAGPTGGMGAQPNVYDQSAANLGAASQAAQSAAQYQPMRVGAGNLAPYQNRFDRQVTDRTLAGLQRQQQMSLNDIGASATAAGAFGGSRHGVAEAEAMRGYADTAANTLANLNQQGFNTALNASMQAQMANQQAGLAGAGQRLSAAGTLGNLSNLGFGMGQQVQQQQMQQGTQQQAMMQALIDAGRGQFAGYAGAPAQGLGQILGAVGGVPSGQTQTTSQQPGLFNYLSAAFGFL